MMFRRRFSWGWAAASAALAIAALLASPAMAVTYQWDVAPADSAVTDGSGTWTAGSGNWLDVDTTTYDQNWANGNVAQFGTGTAGDGTSAVAVSGVVVPTQINFNLGYPSVSYSLSGVSGTDRIGFTSDTATLTISTAADVTSTISADIRQGTLPTNNVGNRVTKTGAGKLILSGNVLLYGDHNGSQSTQINVDGGELEVTGYVKATDLSGTGGRGTGNSTIGVSTASTMKVTGSGRVVSGTVSIENGSILQVSSATPNGSAASQANPSWYQFHQNLLYLGVTTANNLLVVDNGAYWYSRSGGGTNTWNVGQNAGADSNELRATGAGSTIDRRGLAGSAINVGWAGSGNKMVITSGAVVYPRRLGVGVGGGNNNFVDINGGTLNLNDSQPSFGVGTNKAVDNSAATAGDGNYVWIRNGGQFLCNGANNRGYNVAGYGGADDNYVLVEGTSSLFQLKQNQPLAIGGQTGTNNGNHFITDWANSGNYLKIRDGASGDFNSLYIMGNSDGAGTNTKFILGEGGVNLSTATVNASVGNAMYSAGVVLYNANTRMEMNNGKLIAGSTANNFVTGSGQLILNGPAYFSTAQANSLISVAVSGAGDLIKEEVGGLTGQVEVTGALSYTGDTIVNAGTLKLTYAGTPGLSDTSAVRMLTGSAMNLNFTGIDTIGSFYLDGGNLGAGTYDATTYPSLFTGTGSLLVVPAGPNVWKGLANGHATSNSGDWADTGHWTNGTVPNAAGATGTLSGGINASATVDLQSADATVGTLALDVGTPSGSYTLQASGTGKLKLNNSGSGAAVTVQSGAHSITAPVVLEDNTTVTVTGGELNVTNAITESGGAKSLTLAAASAGKLRLGGNNYSAGPTGGTTAAGGTLQLDTANALANGSALTLSGTATVSLGGATSSTLSNTAVKVGDLTINGDATSGLTAKLDLNKGRLIVDKTGASVSVIRNQIKSAYGGGNWTGKGITSGAAAADRVLFGSAAKTGVGYLDNAILASQGGSKTSWQGRTGLNSNSVLVRFTYYGDANLDGAVNLADFGLLKANYGTGSHWYQGDFDYSGTVNLADFGKLKAAYGSTPLGAAAVPEPSVVALLLTGVLAIGYRLFRRRK